LVADIWAVFEGYLHGTGEYWTWLKQCFWRYVEQGLLWQSDTCRWLCADTEDVYRISAIADGQLLDGVAEFSVVLELWMCLYCSDTQGERMGCLFRMA